MKLRNLTVLSLGMGATLWAADPAATLKTDTDKASYAIGMDIGKTFKKQGVDINPDVLLQGLKASLGGGATLLTEAEAKEALVKLNQVMSGKHETLMKEQAAKNQTEGDAFLAANKLKEGVRTLPSGLQYKVISAGNGKLPKITDTVKTNYRGTLLDGTEFDSSYKRNQPATFPVNRVIPGWTEALQLMPVGSKWQLYVPSNLAYGEHGAGGVIGPNATLIFEIELLGIEDSAPAGQN